MRVYLIKSNKKSTTNVILVKLYSFIFVVKNNLLTSKNKNTGNAKNFNSNSFLLSLTS